MEDTGGKCNGGEPPARIAPCGVIWYFPPIHDISPLVFAPRIERLRGPDDETGFAPVMAGGIARGWSNSPATRNATRRNWRPICSTRAKRSSIMCAGMESSEPLGSGKSDVSTFRAWAASRPPPPRFAMHARMGERGAESWRMERADAGCRILEQGRGCLKVFLPGPL